MALPYPTLTAEEAAALVRDGQTIAFSGFTAAGAAKAVPRAIAARARAEHAEGRPFSIGVLAGASTGPSLDGALAAARAVRFRTPYQSDPALRALVNSGEVPFFDLHLSTFPQSVRCGFLGPVDLAVVEACDVTADGGLVLTSSVGATPTFCGRAARVVVELNAAHPAALRGFHDLFEPRDPPRRQVIPIFRPSDRIGTPILALDRRKVLGVVLTDEADECTAYDAGSPETARIGAHVAEFLVGEVRAGRLPPAFLPLQSGVGDVANAVLAAIAAHPEVPAFEMYTEVAQDAVFELLEAGRCRFVSTSGLALSPPARRRLVGDLDRYRDRLVLRPQEITNHPEVVRRLGVVSLNTALELDLAGNVNSTHVLGSQLVNGIGGSADFTRNAYLSIFSCASTARGGRISTVVPLVSHVDHSEHSVQILATEHGVADLRGKDPHARAALVVERCAHPDYRPILREYLRRCARGHAPVALGLASAMHRQLAATGDMRDVDWDRWGRG